MEENKEINQEINENEIPEETADTDAATEGTPEAAQEESVTEPAAEQENETDAPAEEAEETEEEPDAAGKNLFGRKKEKKDKKDERIEELTDQVRRQMAEFDNFRKRTEKEKSQMFETGAKSIIEKILPVIDNFERGLATVPEEEKANPFVDGMDKIYKQLLTTLEEAGVKPIEAVGAPFDPNLHNAVMHIDDDSFDENIVAEEFQKGYTYRDSVVRHSMVKVAN